MVIPKLQQLPESNAPNSTIWTEYQIVSAYLVDAQRTQFQSPQHALGDLAICETSA